MKLTATFGAASLLVLQQVQSATSLADGSPLSALPQSSGLLLGVHPELLGVASIHLEAMAGTRLAHVCHPQVYLHVSWIRDQSTNGPDQMTQSSLVGECFGSTDDLFCLINYNFFFIHAEDKFAPLGGDGSASVGSFCVSSLYLAACCVVTSVFRLVTRESLQSLLIPLTTWRISQRPGRQNWIELFDFWTHC